MTTIYLVRHAEAEGNLYRVAQGQQNSNLTERGWRQIRALEKRFENIHIDAVYASDLYRACGTAGAIFLPKGLPLRPEPRLREICIGSWEGRTWGDIARLWPEELSMFQTKLHRWHVEGAEEPRAVQQRIVEVVRELAQKHDGQTIALVSHGYAIRVLLGTLQGYSLEQIGSTPHGDNTAVSMLEMRNGQLEVVYRDDNSHLMTPEFLAEEKVMERATALEPGLWFAPLCLPEQADIYCALVRDVWAEWRPDTPFDEHRLLAAAAERPTFLAYLRQEPVGAVQFGPQDGWLSLACIRADHRKQGFGAQLIGQAILWAQREGCRTLCIMPGSNSYAFWQDHGFAPAQTGEKGVWEKELRWDPRFMVSI